MLSSIVVDPPGRYPAGWIRERYDLRKIEVLSSRLPLQDSECAFAASSPRVDEAGPGAAAKARLFEHFARQHRPLATDQLCARLGAPRPLLLQMAVIVSPAFQAVAAPAES